MCSYSLKSFFKTLVDIGKVNISQTAPIGLNAQEPFTLECSVEIFPDPLPHNISSPTFQWTINNSSRSNYSSIISNATKNDSHYSTSQLLPLPQEFTSRTYTCNVMGNRELSASILISKCTVQLIIIKKIDIYILFVVFIQISDGGIPPVLGQNYTLSCNSSANITSYQWMKDGRILMNEVEEVISFNPLTLLDDGNYSCEVDVDSVWYKDNNFSLQSKC